MFTGAEARETSTVHQVDSRMTGDHGLLILLVENFRENLIGILSKNDEDTIDSFPSEHL